MGTGFVEFLTIAIAEEDTDCFEAIFNTAFDIMMTVADHHGLRLIGDAGGLQRIGDDIGLAGAGGIHGGAADMVEVLTEAKVLKNLLGVDFRFGGGQHKGESGCTQIAQHFGDTIKDGIFENTLVTKIDAVMGNCLESLVFVKSIPIMEADMQRRADEANEVFGVFDNAILAEGVGY